MIYELLTYKAVAFPRQFLSVAALAQLHQRAHALLPLLLSFPCVRACPHSRHSVPNLSKLVACGMLDARPLTDAGNAGAACTGPRNLLSNAPMQLQFSSSCSRSQCRCMLQPWAVATPVAIISISIIVIINIPRTCLFSIGTLL